MFMQINSEIFYLFIAVIFLHKCHYNLLQLRFYYKVAISKTQLHDLLQNDNIAVFKVRKLWRMAFYSFSGEEIKRLHAFYLFGSVFIYITCMYIVPPIALNKPTLIHQENRIQIYRRKHQFHKTKQSSPKFPKQDVFSVVYY